MLVCWSDGNPFGFGPNRISQRDIREAFADGWTVEAIEPTTLDTLLAQATVTAWLAALARRE